MGALHEGHAELARTAVEQNDVVVASIFVNPLQFGEAVDLERYPRTLDADLALLDAVGVDLVFAPDVEEVYPGGEPRVRISAGPMAEKWEGASRPGHFDGALTVVAKLLHYGMPGAAAGPGAAGLPGVLRPEGRPAAGAGPAHGGGPELPRGDRPGADRALRRRPGAVQPQPLPLRRRNARPPWCSRGRCGSSRNGPTPTSRWTSSPRRRWWSPSRSWNWTTSRWWIPRTLEPLAENCRDTPFRGEGLAIIAAKVGPVRLIDNVPLNS